MIRLAAAALAALILLPVRPLSAQVAVAPTGQAAVPATTQPLKKTVLTMPSAKSPTGGETFGVEPALTVALDAGPTAAAAFDAHGAYLPLKNGELVAIDFDTGQVRWTEEVATTFPAAVSGGLVVVAGDEMLSGYDTATGAVRWQVPVPGGFSAPPLADTGWAVAVAADGSVYCVRASDGSVLWTHALGARAAERPFIAADAVYFAMADKRVVALSLLTGEPRWERMLPGTPGALLVLDDRIFVGADDKFLYCLNPKNGKQRWRWRTGGRPAGPASVDEKHVYYVAYDDILWALDRNGGSLKWRVLLPMRPSGGPVVLGDVVVVAGVTLELYGYRAQNGVVVGKTTFQADVAWAPQIIPGPVRQLSALAVVTREGRFQLLRRQVEPPPITMPYPLGEEIPLTAIVPPPVTVAPVPPSETQEPGQAQPLPPTDAPISPTPAPATPPPGQPDDSGRLQG